MTREFCKRLHEEFPESPPSSRKGYMHYQFNFEQFAVTRKGEWKKVPALEEIIQIAKRTLKRVKHLYSLKTDLEIIQGAGKGDIVIIPGYQSSKTAHAIALQNLDIKNLRVHFTISWHNPHGINPNQTE